MGDVQRQMAVKNIRHVPIAADDQQLLGLASQYDVACTMPEAAQAALEQIMLTEACTTTPGPSLRQTALVLQGHKVGLPAGDR
jgi:predicted transcriptional regulator|tara:strand:+ start:205 stop:453 length:249 start_codon:yes stop_codon:yes gene_type:complete